MTAGTTSRARARARALAISPIHARIRSPRTTRRTYPERLRAPARLTARQPIRPHSGHGANAGSDRRGTCSNADRPGIRVPEPPSEADLPWSARATSCSSPSDAIPEAAKPVARDHGRVVLAYGEATGHAHAIASAGRHAAPATTSSATCGCPPPRPSARGARRDRDRAGLLPHRHPARVRPGARQLARVAPGDRLMAGMTTHADECEEAWRAQRPVDRTRRPSACRGGDPRAVRAARTSCRRSMWVRRRRPGCVVAAFAAQTRTWIRGTYTRGDVGSGAQPDWHALAEPFDLDLPGAAALSSGGSRRGLRGRAPASARRRQPVGGD